MITLNYFWLFIRFSILFIISGLLIDIELLLLTIAFFYLHLINGLGSILVDYIHDKETSFFIITLLRILLLENLIQVVIYFF